MRKLVDKQKLNSGFGYITPRMRELSEDELHDYIVAHRWDLQMELRERDENDDK